MIERECCSKGWGHQHMCACTPTESMCRPLICGLFRWDKVGGVFISGVPVWCMQIKIKLAKHSSTSATWHQPCTTFSHMHMHMLMLCRTVQCGGITSSLAATQGVWRCQYWALHSHNDSIVIHWYTRVAHAIQLIKRRFGIGLLNRANPIYTLLLSTRCRTASCMCKIVRRETTSMRHQPTPAQRYVHPCPSAHIRHPARIIDASCTFWSNLNLMWSDVAASSAATPKISKV